MPSVSPLQLAAVLAAAAFLIALLAEKLHLRRIDAAARLAVGPAGEVRRWVKATPYVRAACLSAIVWSLLTLYFYRGGVYQGEREGSEDPERQRVVFLADLSPSMHVADAGPGGDQKRVARMHDVVDAVLQRLDGQVLFSVICFYTDVLPAVVDADDSELVRNIFAGLPVWYVMESGKTDLGTGVRESLQMFRDYPEKSTTLFVCTDGDTVPVGLVPRCPAAVRDVYVLGVGDPQKGTFIDDHLSRQDAAVLGALAGRLGGQYVDVNEKHVPTRSLGTLARSKVPQQRRVGVVDIAICVFASAASLLALLPVGLALFGSDWRAVRPSPRVETN